MTHDEFQQFQSEFRELTRRLRMNCYALVLTLEPTSKGEMHSVVVSRVVPTEDPVDTLEQLQSLLKALGLLLFELTEKGLGIRNQQAVGMLHGLLTDISDEIDAEADEISRQAALPPKDDGGNWN